MRIIMILLAVFLFACNSDSTKTGTKDSVAERKINRKVDSSYYSKSFLYKMKDYKTMKLDGDGVIYESQRIAFPDILAFSTLYRFWGENDSVDYSLEVLRINYTTIRYTVKQTNRKAKRMITYTGEANLDPGFVLAAEVDEDPETGESYGAYEYTADQKANCQHQFRIAVARDNKNRLRCMINSTCNYEYWHDIPILRTRSKKAPQ